MTDLTVCTDCAAVITNNDDSGLDNNPATAAQRRAEITAGLIEWSNEGRHLVITGDAGYENSACDCCNSRLAGQRHQATAMRHHATATH